MPVRSLDEILFRLKQEVANLYLFLSPPRIDVDVAAPLAGLPDPEAVARSLRDQPYAVELLRLAESILANRIPLLGLGECSFGGEVPWRRDFLDQRESGLKYFRRVPYLDVRRVGDHKIIWELNRHQHLVVLAQAWRLSGDWRFSAAITTQLRHWERENSYLRGINWTSALEVAFRVLSWIWIYHLAGEAFEIPFRRWMVEQIYRHGCYLEQNLSVYFSPNTHLLGEAVALAAAGRLFPALPRSARWRELGSTITDEAMRKQVRDDGSHFEQSTYYHVYALDFFLFHLVGRAPSPVAGPPAGLAPPWYRDKLVRMAEYLDALVPPSGRVPFLGDDDGGRLFHPYGDRSRFALGSLATAAALLGRGEWLRDRQAFNEQAAWWLGPAVPAPAPVAPASVRFAGSGLCVMTAGAAHIVVDTGEMGPGSAGHSHADALSLTFTLGGEELLIDPGTYTYVGGDGGRDRFRGVAMHNTVQVDGLEQADPAGPFRWLDPPSVELLAWAATETEDRVDARCRYRGITHQRLCVFRKPDGLMVTDRVEGPAGIHEVVVRWHSGVPVREVSPQVFELGERARLTMSLSGKVEDDWRSRAFGAKEPISTIVARYRGQFPCEVTTMIAWRH